MERIEFNVQTGEYKVIQLTPDEIADARDRSASEDAQRQENEDMAAIESKRRLAIDAMLEKLAGENGAPEAVSSYVEARAKL